MILLSFAIMPPSVAERERGGRGGSEKVSFGVTGDFNLAVNHETGLPPFEDPREVWGDTIKSLKTFDALLINHESTIAGVYPDSHPSGYRYEDPENYLKALTAANPNTFVSQANNHQFDFWGEGLNSTIQALRESNVTFGGIGSYHEVRKPQIVELGKKVRLAIFTVVAQMCHLNSSTGEPIFTSCTCGLPSSMSGLPPRQCYHANLTDSGLWFLDYPVGDKGIQEVSKAIKFHRASGGHRDFIVVFFHAGPNFEWHPNRRREALLRAAIDAGADLVWGTSSHHIQRMERWKRKPIIYGLGDVLFRLIPGVTFLEACEAGQSPCEQFRPEVSIVYQFYLSESDFQDSPFITGIQAHVTRHDLLQTNFGSKADKEWAMNIFNELSMGYGYKMQRIGDELWIEEALTVD
ncbi:hypothetical protein AAMO2058_000708500 [Amorphochlora amoebiformis]